MGQGGVGVAPTNGLPRSSASCSQNIELSLAAGRVQMGQGGGAPDERLAKIQRYRERRVQRGQARVPNYQSARHKVTFGVALSCDPWSFVLCIKLYMRPGGHKHVLWCAGACKGSRVIGLVSKKGASKDLRAFGLVSWSLQGKASFWFGVLEPSKSCKHLFWCPGAFKGLQALALVV
eukprot:1156142-Pelagomonas_calceolata.AAC.7